MAKKKIFSTGVGDDITLTGGDLFIAMHFGGGAAPTGWEVADGGTFTFAPFAIKPDFSGSYVRGAAALNSAIQGERDHTHVWPDSTPVSNTDFFQHSLSAATPSNTAQGGGGPIISTSSIHTTPGNDHDHNHGDAVFTPVVDPIQHIPDSQVMEFITKALGLSELAAFSKGTILGFLGTVIPTGWQLANGTNGTPNLISRFPVAGAAPGTSGSEDHESDVSLFGTQQAGLHNHTTTAVNGGGSNVLSAGPGTVDDPVHTHTVSSEGLHGHNIPAIVSDTVNNLPPFREMPYIIKMAAQVGSNNAIASGVHIMYDPDLALPSGWSTRTATYDGLNFVGRLVGDPDFGNTGPVGDPTHTHALSVAVPAAGAHGHTSSGDNTVATSNFVAGGAPAALDKTHTHTLSAEGNHTHSVNNQNTVAADNRPPSTNVDILEKTP